MALTLIALAMLSYAQVRSFVMRAGVEGVAQATTICSLSGLDGISTSAAPDPGHASSGHSGAKHHGVCPFCAAAASPPLISTAAFCPLPVTFVWPSFGAREDHAVRGPSPTEARARGPPLGPISA
ncbi:MAG: DUF2946 family protein [Caulobacteraceae bacterium]